MTRAKDLLRQALATPEGRQEQLLVYADYLEEAWMPSEGSELDLAGQAEAWRWLAEKGYWPYKHTGVEEGEDRPELPWCWGADELQADAVRDRLSVPGDTYGCRRYETLEGALGDFLQAFARARHAGWRG